MNKFEYIGFKGLPDTSPEYIIHYFGPRLVLIKLSNAFKKSRYVYKTFESMAK